MVSAVNATVCARLVSAVISGITCVEQESEALLRSAGLSDIDLTDSDLRVPARQVAQLWQEAVHATGNRHIGFLAGARIRSGMFGVVDYAARCGTTLHEFFVRLTRYRRLIADGLDLRLLQRGEQVRMAFDIALDSTEARRQMNEFFAAATLALGRDATGVHWKPERLAFRHSPVGDDTAFKTWFGTELSYREPTSSM